VGAGRLEKAHKREELMHKCIGRENGCAEARRPENDPRGVMQSCISEARMHRGAKEGLNGVGPRR